LAEKVVTLHTKVRYRWTGTGEDGKPFTKIYDTTPGRVILSRVLPAHPAARPAGPSGRDLRRREQAHDQEGDLGNDRRRLPQLRSEGDGHLLRPHHGARLLSRVQGRHLLRQGRHGRAREQVVDRRGDAGAGEG